MKFARNTQDWVNVQLAGNQVTRRRDDLQGTEQDNVRTSREHKSEIASIDNYSMSVAVRGLNIFI